MRKVISFETKKRISFILRKLNKNKELRVAVERLYEIEDLYDCKDEYELRLAESYIRSEEDG